MRVMNFLLFCSGVSRQILDKCPDSERIKHSSIGASVLFTALLAIISSFYAFSLIFSSIWKALFVSFFWGLIIFNLDRFIVATLRKRENFLDELIQVSPRLILSMVIAFVIAKPLELEIFKSEINQSLNEQLVSKISLLETKFNEKDKNLDLQKDQLGEEIKEFFYLKEKYYQEYRCECDGTCGTGKTGRGSECLRKQEKYEEFIKEFNAKQQAVANALEDIKLNKADNEILYIQEKENLEANYSYGLLSRLNALHGLDSIAPWFISLLILLVEIAPVLTKLFTPKGPYDNLLAANEGKYKFEYLRKIHDEEQIKRQYQGGILQQTQLMKKEYLSEKQKMIKELYKELGQELTKNLNK